MKNLLKQTLKIIAGVAIVAGLLLLDARTVAECKSSAKRPEACTAIKG